MYSTSDLPVMSKTPLPNMAMFLDLKAQMIHSMRLWADSNEEKVLLNDVQVQVNITVNTPISQQN